MAKLIGNLERIDDLDKVIYVKTLMHTILLLPLHRTSYFILFAILKTLSPSEKRVVGKSDPTA